MRELYTLELIRLTKELKTIEGFYIDQFYEIERNRFRFKLSRKGEKGNLQCILPYTLNRTEVIELKEEATNFSLAVRKRISGARIKGIEQFNKDRIIIIKLERGGEESNIIMEMFGRGNMIFTESDMKIQLAYIIHDFKDRVIRPGQVYKPPKNSSMDFLESKNLNELEKERDIGKEQTTLNYLSKRIGIGKIYLEEAIARSGITPEAKLNTVTNEKFMELLDNIKDLIKECTEKPEFIAYQKDGLTVNFSLCSIKKFSSFETKPFDSFEGMLDFVYQNAEFRSEEVNEEEEKIISSIEKQKHILEEIDNEIKGNRAAGDYIMNHMHELNAILQAVKSNKNMDKEQLQRLSEEIEILNINMKTKSIRVKEKSDDK